jgi:hypothetical protein
MKRIKTKLNILPKKFLQHLKIYAFPKSFEFLSEKLNIVNNNDSDLKIFNFFLSFWCGIFKYNISSFNAGYIKLKSDVEIRNNYEKLCKNEFEGVNLTAEKIDIEDNCFELDANKKNKNIDMDNEDDEDKDDFMALSDMPDIPLHVVPRK